ncbi:hypothetical protein RRG08_018851 [Elysia crispata]|uniref:Uncharacterized protein n=1 Tax=Elysia crispata TaxID=231223 RepID=A0AAE1B770_9GAST|nr:hypothetical protein RRG08_018851 [Elysia crispata]
MGTCSLLRHIKGELRILRYTSKSTRRGKAHGIKPCKLLLDENLIGFRSVLKNGDCEESRSNAWAGRAPRLARPRQSDSRITGSDWPPLLRQTPAVRPVCRPQLLLIINASLDVLRSIVLIRFLANTSTFSELKWKKRASSRWIFQIFK